MSMSEYSVTKDISHDTKMLESVIKDVKTVCEHEDVLRNQATLKTVLTLLEELKFRRDNANLLENCEDMPIVVNGRVLEAGQRYKHFKKGNVYTVVIPRVYDTKDLKEYVIYRGSDNKRRCWARPVEEFMSEVDRNKYPQATQQYRFELIEDGEESGL